MLVLDQRSNPRLPLEIFVNQEFSQVDQRLGMSVDLSLQGMSLVTLPRVAPPAGRHAWVRFWLPGSEILISALAQVVHQAGGEDVERYGLRFKYLFPDQKELLRGYLAAQPVN